MKNLTNNLLTKRILKLSIICLGILATFVAETSVHASMFTGFYEPEAPDFLNDYKE